MINLRYHIVSLTAVFLALGIGVLLGGTYLDKYTVDQLDQSINNAEERIRVTSAENDRLRGELGDAEARNRALLDAGTTELFGGHLTDVPVLVVAAEGTDETARRNLVRALASSGAEFRGTLTVTERIDLADDDQLAVVGAALDLDDDATPAEVRTEVIRRFGEALADAGAAADDATGPDATDPEVTQPEVADPTTTVAPDPDGSPPTTEPAPDTSDPAVDPGGDVAPSPGPVEATQPEVVTLLLEQGILAFEQPAGAEASSPLLSDTGYRYVFLSGPDPAVPDSRFLVPTLNRMAELGPVPVVMVSAATSGTERDAVVADIRTDAELSRLVSTVDNLESFNGIASTVLALDEIGRGARGHYGEGRGSAAPLPTGT